MAKKKSLDSQAPSADSTQPAVETAVAPKPSNCQRCHSMLSEIYDPKIVNKSDEAKRLMAAKQELDVILGLAPEGGKYRTFGTEPYGGSNIVATEIHQKHAGGVTTGEFCILVYVLRKAPEGAHVFGAIPKLVNGVPTDIEVIGDVKPHIGQPGGAITGVPGVAVMRGTFGALVKCRDAGDVALILSNQHVMNPSGFTNVVGGAINSSGQKIAELATWTPTQHPTVDGALAAVTDLALVDRNYATFIDLNSNPMSSQEVTNEGSANGNRVRVKKYGSETGPTSGILNTSPTNVNSSGEPQFGIPPRSFESQWLITSTTNSAFSLGGDSGSLVVHEDTNRPIALLWGGSGRSSFANQIELVQSVFGITEFM